MTAHAQATVQAIHKDKAARLAALKARGIRDEITVMEWPNGMCEVTGETKRGRFGCKHSHPTLAEWAKHSFGSGILRKIKTGAYLDRENIQHALTLA